MKSLSIVMQGPVRENGMLSPAVLRNIRLTRQTFPESELIVSSWNVSSVADYSLKTILDQYGVILVLSQDPGAIACSDGYGTHYTSLNRMLRSTQAGMDKTSRPLVIKMRTDTWLSSRRIIPLLTRYVLEEEGPARQPDYQVFRARVINASWFARDARGSLPYLYHPGDIFLAGLKEDVLLFFNVPHADATLFHPTRMSGLWCAWRYVPEQWCWVHAISAVTGKIPWAGNFQRTPADVIDSEQYYLANFVPFSPRALSLHWPKYWRRYALRGLFSTLTHRRWLYLAERTDAGRQGYSASLPGRLMSQLWRTGYRLRARLLSFPQLRRMALKLAGRRG